MDKKERGGRDEFEREIENYNSSVIYKSIIFRIYKWLYDS